MGRFFKATYEEDEDRANPEEKKRQARNEQRVLALLALQEVK
jgi:hypothetical protein